MKSLKNIIKIILTGVLLLGTGQICSAQSNTEVFRFDEETWDFGTIREIDGLVSHIFNFKNTSSRAVIIERVNSDCGCTVPKYSSEPIRPGRESSIEVVFNPENYGGRFSKSVFVISDNGKSRNKLTITGNVVARERSPEETYPYPLAGSVRADNLRLPFEYIQNGETNSMAVGIINNSSKPANIEVYHIEASGRLRVDAPKTLGANERSSITFTYDLSEGDPIYGMIGDNVHIVVDGVRSDMAVTTHAIAIDNFSNVDPSQTPGSYINPSFFNLGKVSKGATVTKEIAISNTGTAPLIIRSVAPRKNTEIDLAPDVVINPGSTSSFTLSVTAGEREGVSTAGITVITNDPERPMREVRLVMEVAK